MRSILALSVLVAACSDPNTAPAPAPAPTPTPKVVVDKPRCARDAPIIYEQRSIGRGTDTDGYTVFSPQKLTVRDGGSWTYEILAFSQTGCLSEAEAATLVAALDAAAFDAPDPECSRTIHVEHVVTYKHRTLTFYTFVDGTIKPCGAKPPPSVDEVLRLLGTMIVIPVIPAR